MRRILIFYLVERSGHHAAARAVERALCGLSPDTEVRCVDILAHMHPRWARIIERTYLVTIRRTPELWHALYDSAWAERYTRRIRSLVQRGTGQSLLALMDSYRPDAVVCTQAHPFGVVSAYAARFRPTLPVWGVVTDFLPHRFWVSNGALSARYVVPTEEAADRLVWLGVDSRSVDVIGIPAEGVPQHPVASDTAAARTRVLVMGGSRGIGTRYRTVRCLDASEADFTIDVVCGSNRVLQRQLAGRRGRFRHPLRVRGYVSNVPVLMQRSSLVLTKPGGITSAEALAQGVPLLLVRPLPGQERMNTDVLVRHGAALHVEREADVAPVVTNLLQHPELLRMMRTRAKSFGRPNAARDIAKRVLESCEDA